MGLGAALLTAALVLTVYNLWTDHRAAAKSGAMLSAVAGNRLTVSDVPDWRLHPDMEMPEVEVDGQRYIGTLSIPAMDVELPVISHWSEEALRVAPCRYAGSAYTEGFVIAAHNYGAHFGRIKSLAEGDEVTFTDMDGNIFRYRVVLTEVLSAGAVKEMNDDSWALTLFTCTWGGVNRTAVRCEAVR